MDATAFGANISTIQARTKERIYLRFGFDFTIKYSRNDDDGWLCAAGGAVTLPMFCGINCSFEARLLYLFPPFILVHAINWWCTSISMLLHVLSVCVHSGGRFGYILCCLSFVYEFNGNCDSFTILSICCIDEFVCFVSCCAFCCRVCESQRIEMEAL